MPKNGFKFGNIEAADPPAELFNRVMLSLDREQKIVQLKKKLIFFSIFLFLSFAASLPAARALSAEMSRTGFGQYLMLVFYDFRSIAAYWQDFSFMLLETLPATSLAAALFVLLAILVSLRSFGRNISLFIKLANNHSY